MNRDFNFSQYVVNEIVLDYLEGYNLNDYASLSYDENKKRIVINHGIGDMSEFELMIHHAKIMYPNRREESIEFECMRLLSNLSVTEFANLCGVTKQSISQMLNGERRPSSKVLSIVKEYLKIENQ